MIRLRGVYKMIAGTLAGVLCLLMLAACTAAPVAGEAEIEVEVLDSAAAPIDVPLRTNNRYHYTDKTGSMTIDEIAQALTLAMITDMQSKSDTRTFVITDYRNIECTVYDKAGVQQIIAQTPEYALIYPELAQGQWVCCPQFEFQYTGSVSPLGDASAVPEGEYVINQLFWADALYLIQQDGDSYTMQRYGMIGDESLNSTVQQQEVIDSTPKPTFSVMTDDNAPVGCEVGFTSDGEDTQGMLDALADMQGFVFDVNSDQTLALIFSEQPLEFTVRYLTNEGYVKEYPCDGSRIVVPNGEGIYNLFVEIRWEEAGVQTAYFSITVEDQRAGVSIAERQAVLEQAQERKAQYLPVLQQLIEDYKSGKIIERNQTENCYAAYPQDQPYPELNTVDDFMLAAVNGEITTLEARFSLGRGADRKMKVGLISLNEAVCDGETEKLATAYAVFESNPTTYLYQRAGELTLAIQSFISENLKDPDSISMDEPTAVVRWRYCMYPTNPELTYLRFDFYINSDKNEPIAHLCAVPDQRWDEFTVLDVPECGTLFGDFIGYDYLTMQLLGENVSAYEGAARDKAQKLIDLLTRLKNDEATLYSVYSDGYFLEKTWEMGLSFQQVHSLENMGFTQEGILAMTEQDIKDFFAPGTHQDGAGLEGSEEQMDALAQHGIDDEMSSTLMLLGYTYEDMLTISKEELDFIFPNIELVDNLVSKGYARADVEYYDAIYQLGYDSYRDLIREAMER